MKFLILIIILVLGVTYSSKDDSLNQTVTCTLKNNIFKMHIINESTNSTIYFDCTTNIFTNIDHTNLTYITETADQNNFSLDLTSYGYTYLTIDNFWVALVVSLDPTIKISTVSDTYNIFYTSNGIYESNNTEIIDTYTGLVTSKSEISSSGEILTSYKYNLNNVSDAEVELPDLTLYTQIYY